MIRQALLLLALSATALPAQDIRAPDRDHLAAFDESLGHGLRQALAFGAADDVAIVTEALRGAPQGPPLTGDWRCRVAKLGGETDLVVYPDFACRVEMAEDGWRLRKLTGSQRFEGTIAERDGAHIFLGVGHVGDAPATDYAGLPPTDQTPVEPNQTTPEIAIWETVSDTRARLMFPFPLLESDFDLVILSR